MKRTDCHRLLLALVLIGLGWMCPARGEENVTSVLDRILDAPALQGGITGAVVVRVQDGQMLYARNPDIRLLPASNRKLFTAAAALGVLGRDFTFKTQVLSTRKPDAQGTLHGDLVLHGSGDSALTTADLTDLAAQVARAGVKCIQGNVYGDGTVFTDAPYGFGWEWDDFSDEEFPQIAGLEVNHGDVAVHLEAGTKIGAPVRVTFTPALAAPPVANMARTGAAGEPSDCTITRPYGSSGIQVQGTLTLGAHLDQNVPVDTPPLYVARLFAGLLDSAGISIRGHAVCGAPPSAATVALARHISLPLSGYLPLMNKPSDNLIAESFIRTLGVVSGKGGTYEAGHDAETLFFARLGVATTALDLRDGCGVSRRDFVTARAVGQLLLGMHARSDWKAYYDSLPIAGVDGTLKSRMLKTAAEGNVHAKTGTLSQVRCLSGYVTGKAGDMYVFSLLMNNFPGNAKSAGDVQDQFVEYLAQTL